MQGAHRTPHAASTRSPPFSLPFSLPLSLSPSVATHAEHKDKAGQEWRKTVPSYNQSSSGAMDFRTWNTLPHDESQEPLPKTWEMAYTETGMVYFIE